MCEELTGRRSRVESGLVRETGRVVRTQMVTEDRGKQGDKTTLEGGPRSGREMSCLMAGREAQVCK